MNWATSRSSTLISYTGIDHKIMNCILEIKGSIKLVNTCQEP